MSWRHNDLAAIGGAEAGETRGRGQIASGKFPTAIKGRALDKVAKAVGTCIAPRMPRAATAAAADRRVADNPACYSVRHERAR
jgi:hypothetical protein